ncbi:MAG: methyltransferase domain-containing protein [Vicinamibacterales bacterium]
MIPRAVITALGRVHRGFADAWARDLNTSRRKLLGIDRTVTHRYLESHSIRKLHLGCGRNLLPGWLNSDFFPKSPAVLHLDARGRFPLQDGQFDFVFSEHMIEHIAYAKGSSMVNESFRVLKPGGTLRISTPDLAFLLDLRRSDRTPLQEEYIRWSTHKFMKAAPYADDTFVINNFVRRWGHLFIYDEKTLRATFVAAGFENVVRCALNESAHQELRGLENEKRMPKGFLQLETMTLEGSKPMR